MKGRVQGRHPAKRANGAVDGAQEESPFTVDPVGKSDNPPLMLRDREAARLAGTSQSTWRRMNAREICPAPINLGVPVIDKKGRQRNSIVRWFEPEVRAWTALCAERGKRIPRDEWEPIWRKIRKAWIGGAA